MKYPKKNLSIFKSNKLSSFFLNLIPFDSLTLNEDPVPMIYYYLRQFEKLQTFDNYPEKYKNFNVWVFLLHLIQLKADSLNLQNEYIFFITEIQAKSIIFDKV